VLYGDEEFPMTPASSVVFDCGQLAMSVPPVDVDEGRPAYST
jgi:hypothetical protein